MAALQDVFLACLSPTNEIRQQAEAYLNSIEGQPGFLIAVLQLVSEASTAAAIRQSAAVLFKNVVKRRWSPEEDSDLSRIADADRETVRTHLIDLMCSTPNEIQKQLAEAVAIIAKYDFPDEWVSLLPQLVTKLAGQDLHITKGVMLTANSIMKRFRYAYASESLNRDIVICLRGFQEPLLEVFKRTSLAVDAAAADRDRLQVLMETLRLMSRVYFSLNWQEIPEFFEDHIAEWMTEFLKYLTYTNPLLIDASETSESGPIERLQAAIIENLNIYVTKYEEEFSPYLGPFTQSVWSLLLQVGPESKYDNLATCAIKFLTSVSGKQMNMPLFTDQVLKDIVEHIVIRNVSASAFDEELFEDNPTDYIRKDMEGSDQDTRRRCAMELVRSLLKLFPVQVSKLCTDYIGAMLEQYRVSMNWHAKDAALHLFLAVAVMSNSVSLGAGELNPHIQLIEIFSSQVLPEINDPDVNARPIVKADAIKLICMFRNFLQGPLILGIIPNLIRYLRAESVVVQTYAALCIERFLTLKDTDASTGVSTPRITKENLLGLMEQLYTGLFAVLDNTDLPDNDYVMKCLMRTFVLLDSSVLPVLGLVLPRLTTTLERVCKNPINPHFNHYLFECLAILVRSACVGAAASVSNCDTFEGLLFPPFQSILAQDVTEFVPYVFQVLALLLSARPQGGGFSDAYRALFGPILSPVLWERKGNVPALTLLFRAYIRTGMTTIITNGQLEAVLGVFQKLLSSKATEQHAFDLIDSLFRYNTAANISRYIPTIMNLMLLRMQDRMKENKNHRYCRWFLHSVCLFACVHGGRTLFDALEQLTSGLASVIISQVWDVNREVCATISNTNIKHMIIGGTKLLTETPVADNPTVWASLLKSIVVLLPSVVFADQALAEGGAAAAAAARQADTFQENEDDLENREFDSTYSKLFYATVVDSPVCPEVANTGAFFASSMATFISSRTPGLYLPVIKSAITETKEVSAYTAVFQHETRPAVRQNLMPF